MRKNRPVSTPDPDAFAQRWLEAWNDHDIDAVLEQFSDDVVFTSPVAAKLLPDTDGVIRGKHALRRYWAVAVERIPDLRFELVGVYVGVSAIVINYRNQAGALVNEVLIFGEKGLVREGYGTYVADIVPQ